MLNVLVKSRCSQPEFVPLSKFRTGSWLVTLTWKVKCLKSLIICFSLFFSSSRNRVCVSASQAQFPVVPVYYTDQFSRWRPFNEWLFKSQTISSFVNGFYRVLLWILDLSYSALSWKLTWCFFLVQRLCKCNIWIAEFFEFYTLQTHGM
jgi:hypothetical protein